MLERPNFQHPEHRAGESRSRVLDTQVGQKTLGHSVGSKIWQRGGYEPWRIQQSRQQGVAASRGCPDPCAWCPRHQMTSRMILEGKHLGRLHLGNPLIDWRFSNQIWAVHMEPGNACSPFVLLRNRPNRRQHPDGDSGVPLTMVSPVVCRPRRGNNRS